MILQSIAKWPGWLWAGLVVFALCSACGLVLFFTYGHYFPDIGGVRDNWDTFGTLLGGFGSCIGAVATLSTLLFLAHQNHKQQIFIDWQMFAGHRQMFFEILAGLQTSHQNSFVFRDPFTLYSALFPMNSPSRVDRVVKADRNDVTGNYLGLLSKRLETLDHTLKDGMWDGKKIHELVGDLLDMAHSLGYQWLKPDENGDILFHDSNYGINIYSLKEFVDRANAIQKAFLVFTGNDVVAGFQQDNCGNPREAMIRYFLKRAPSKRATVAVKSSKNFVLFEKVFALSCEIGIQDQRVLSTTYIALKDVFASRKGLKDLDDPAKLKSFTDISLTEVDALLRGDYANGPVLDDEHCYQLNQVRNDLVMLRASQ